MSKDPCHDAAVRIFLGWQAAIMAEPLTPAERARLAATAAAMAVELAFRLTDAPPILALFFARACNRSFADKTGTQYIDPLDPLLSAPPAGQA